MKPIKVIEKTCIVILKGLKDGHFSRNELELMQTFFQRIADTTKNMLLKVEE